ATRWRRCHDCRYSWRCVTRSLVWRLRPYSAAIARIAITYASSTPYMYNDDVKNIGERNTSVPEPNVIVSARMPAISKTIGAAIAATSADVVSTAARRDAMNGFETWNTSMSAAATGAMNTGGKIHASSEIIITSSPTSSDGLGSQFRRKLSSARPVLIAIAASTMPATVQYPPATSGG